MGSYHPRFWSWVIGSGTPLAMLAEMLAAGLNSNVGGGDHAAVYVEEQVIDWCRQMTGFPAGPRGASGLLVSGGSMANLVGLTVARNTMAGYDLRREGVRPPAARSPSTARARCTARSRRRWSCWAWAARRCGRCRSGRTTRSTCGSWSGSIAADRAAGRRPICVVGNAGTVNTGAFDDLSALADLCRREGLWFHVDGAFGALAALDPGLRAADGGDGAGGLPLLRLPQVDVPALRDRRGAGAQRGGAPPRLLPHPRLPGPRRARAGRRDLAVRLRGAALARLPGAEGLDEHQGARHPQVRPPGSAERGAGPLPGRPGGRGGGAGAAGPRAAEHRLLPLPRRRERRAGRRWTRSTRSC